MYFTRKKDTHGNLASTLFDKRDDFNFSIVLRRKIFLQFLIKDFIIILKNRYIISFYICPTSDLGIRW